ncbi:MAG: AlkZ family DNA glycosylase [Deltaproteobacteria bacterium]|nr:AlkZ family DNA glycosylase [Deltaproteobacteria bacterium]
MALAEPFPRGDEGIVALLDRLDLVQLDPIDRCGQNADLVVAARVEGTRRGDVHRVLRGRSFEHFAKERCIVHARHFAHYRAQAVETPWWRNSERMRKLDEALVNDVLAEVSERGPLTTTELSPRGKTEPMDWAGWKGTSRLEVLALEVLWTRCAVVVSGRDARGRRVYDIPARALPGVRLAPPAEPFAEAMILARVRSAGLLARAGGPSWSMLGEARTDGTVDRLVADGRLVEVRVGRRPYLAEPGILAATPARPRTRAVVLGPLDPLLWDRALVRDALGFDYTWEVYKPAAQRQYGYYVCPVLIDGQLAGRVEARRDGATLRVERAWGKMPRRALDGALSRLAELNNCVAIDVSRTVVS